MNKFFKHYRYQLLFFLVLLIAGVIRGYQLGTIPHGMTWDEAAIGYNGFAIFKAHRDEWLVKMPISFKSFGDYKAPFAIYLNGLFTLIFGMNLWAVRLPFYLSSIAGIAGMMLLVRRVFSEKIQSVKGKFKNYFSANSLSLFAGAVMTFSPWHIHFSRTGFESGMALTFVIWGSYFYLKFINYKQKNQLFSFTLRSFSEVGWLLASIFLFVLSIYTYHSAKIVAPLIGVVLFLFYFKQLKTKIKPLGVGVVAGLAMLYPFIKDSLFGSGAERLSQASFIEEGMTTIQIGSQLIYQYLAHFRWTYLVMGETTSLRHGDGVWGVLFVTTLFLIIIALMIGIIKKKTDRAWWLGFTWVLIGTIPASIGTDVPHANRAFLALPGFIILATWGFDQLIQLIESLKINKEIKGSHDEKDLVVKAVIGSIVLVHLALSFSYLNHYFTVFAKQSAQDFKDGYLEAFSIARDYEKGLNGKPQVDQIVFTNDYGQAYIYALFVRKTDPIWYQGGSLNKYLIKKIDQGDFSRKNTLVVASGEDEFGLDKATQIVMGSDGLPRFILYYLEASNE